MKDNHININGLKISFVERGQSDETYPVIFIHGWLDNAASFNQLAPFINHKYSLAIDLPGHGYSDHISSFSYYHFIDGVSQLIETINQLNINKCILIGHSLGGCIASIVAGSIPDKISNLILLDAIGPLTTPAKDSANKYQLYLKQLSIIKKRKVRNYKDIDEACQMRAASGYISAPLVKDIVERGLINKELGYQWRHDPRLLLPSPLRMTEEQTLNFLKEITAPTLLINASDGYKVDTEDYKLRLDAVKNLTLKEIDCGHHLHIEKPLECAALINDFLTLTS